MNKTPKNAKTENNLPAEHFRETQRGENNLEELLKCLFQRALICKTGFLYSVSEYIFLLLLTRVSLGIILRPDRRSYKLPLLLVLLSMHIFTSYDKNRIEQQS
jgi:hypothetical protein